MYSKKGKKANLWCGSRAMRHVTCIMHEKVQDTKYGFMGTIAPIDETLPGPVSFITIYSMFVKL